MESRCEAHSLWHAWLVAVVPLFIGPFLRQRTEAHRSLPHHLIDVCFRSRYWLPAGRTKSVALQPSRRSCRLRGVQLRVKGGGPRASAIPPLDLEQRKRLRAVGVVARCYTRTKVSCWVACSPGRIYRWTSYISRHVGTPPDWQRHGAAGGLANSFASLAEISTGSPGSVILSARRWVAWRGI
jgi:hypothetical protein